ncbi:transaldolase [Sinimarinibacterium flocculans]|uniref:Transaldolase n=1 Tax=Sinimarinibacterium flocculans TaxID=985250 RepID=A0A318EPM8_9GAMM|nr:transaldolase [Sinimarinibacterium flocculans]PXV71446.1 transaldolase [Sinimarinibacterium flocculans]
MNPLLECHRLGQSIWLDFIRRKQLAEGGLARLVADGEIRGVTSNPAIFEKAIGGSDDYDTALAAAIASGERDPQRLFEQLAIDDIRAAADVLQPVWRDSSGVDGHVSLEVSPHLAMDEEATVRDAERLWHAVDRPNLMIKVPGTAPGVGAMRRLIAQGINVNVTLLFSRAAYAAVAAAYIDGVEAFAAAGGDPAAVASVASFFVSRIDGVLDAEIERRATATPDQAPALRALAGRIAIANARLAYADAGRIYAQPRWQALAQRGARVQRLLWASTGTKNPAYSDVLYVESLIGADTVNTVPPATLDAFRDHGRARATLGEDVDGAHTVFAEIERLGLPLDEVTAQLVDDGIGLFVEAHDKLLAAVAAKRDALLRRVA